MLQGATSCTRSPNTSVVFLFTCARAIYTKCHYFAYTAALILRRSLSSGGNTASERQINISVSLPRAPFLPPLSRSFSFFLYLLLLPSFQTRKPRIEPEESFNRASLHGTATHDAKEGCRRGGGRRDGKGRRERVDATKRMGSRDRARGIRGRAEGEEERGRGVRAGLENEFRF